MLHKFLEPGAWFRPKSYGYGSGLPFKWQGWVLMAVHVGLVFGIALAFQHQPVMVILLSLFAAVVPLPIYAARTEGGWRWRWGRD